MAPRAQSLTWYHTDEGALPSANRVPWTLTGSGATIAISSTADGEHLQITQASTAAAFYTRKLLEADRASSPARPGDYVELQTDMVQGVSSSAGWASGASPIGMGIDDGERAVAVALGAAIQWIDPSDGTVIAEALADHTWLLPHSVRLVKDRSTEWRLYVDGRHVATLPYLAAAASSYAPGRFLWGHLDAAGDSVSRWQGLEAGLNTTVPATWAVERLQTALPVPIQRAWNGTWRALARAVIGSMTQVEEAIRAAWDLRTAGRRTFESRSFTGAVLPETVDGWTVEGTTGEIVRQRWRVSGGSAEYAETEFADTNSDAEFRARATFRVESTTLAEAGTRVGPFVEIQNGHRRVRAELTKVATDQLGWKLVEGALGGPVTQVGEIVWLVEETQPHRVEVQVLGRGSTGRVLLLVDDRVVDDIPYTALTDAVTDYTARVGKLAGDGSAGGGTPSGSAPDIPGTPWGAWDPMVDGVGTITPGSPDTYTYLPDITGNGKHMTGTYSGGAPETAGPFAVNGGTAILPRSSELVASDMLVNNTFGGALTSYCMVSCGRAVDGLTNSQNIGYRVEAGSGDVPAVTLQWESTSGTDGRIVLAQDGILSYVIPGGPTIPWPVAGGADGLGDPDAYWIIAVQRSVSGTTSTWRVRAVADWADGNGLLVRADSLFEETESMTKLDPGEFQRVMNEDVSGVAMEPGAKEVGSAIAYLGTTLTEEELVQAMVWAAYRFGDDEGEAVESILAPAEATITVEDVLAETRYSDLHHRAVFRQAIAERLVFTGGCERNDWLDTLMRTHYGLQELRGSQHATLRELRRLSCSDETALVIETTPAKWYLDVTYPTVSPVYHDVAGTFADLQWEIRYQGRLLTPQELADLAARYLLPVSTLELQSRLWLAAELQGTPSPGSGVHTFDVDVATGFAVGDAVEIRNAANTVLERTTISAISTTTITVPTLSESFASGDFMRKLLASS